jgi:tetratricopeptide (TPR) repeat protein
LPAVLTTILPVSAASSNVEINSASRSFHEAWQTENFPVALEFVERHVKLLENSPHRRSMHHARALINLGKAQQSMGSVRESEKSYKKSIAFTEELKGTYASELTAVLDHLGYLYYNESRPDLAIDTFRRAQHILHRSDGVFTLKQLSFVDSIISIHINTARITGGGYGTAALLFHQCAQFRRRRSADDTGHA